MSFGCLCYFIQRWAGIQKNAQFVFSSSNRALTDSQSVSQSSRQEEAAGWLGARAVVRAEEAFS